MGNMENLTPYQQSKKLRRQAVWWMIMPTIALVAVLSLYAIVTFVFASAFSVSVAPFGALEANAQVETTQPEDQPIQFGENPWDSGPATTPTPTLYQDFDFGNDPDFQALGLGKASPASTVLNIIKMLMGLLGTIAVVLIPVGLIVGVMKVLKANKLPITNYDQRSGKGDASEYPAEIKGWSWGAFGLGIYWTIYHGAWLGLLLLVPYLNFIWIFVMGAKGKKWAWANMKWESVDDYLATQKKWDKWGLIIFIISMVFLVFTIGVGIAFFSAFVSSSAISSGSYQIPVK